MSRGSLTWGFTEEANTATCMVTLDEVEVPPSKYLKVLELLHQSQHKARPSHIHMDAEQGMIGAKTSMPLQDGDLDDTAIDRLFMATMAAAGMIGAKYRAL